MSSHTYLRLAGIGSPATVTPFGQTLQGLTGPLQLQQYASLNSKNPHSSVPASTVVASSMNSAHVSGDPHKRRMGRVLKQPHRGRWCMDYCSPGHRHQQTGQKLEQKCKYSYFYLFVEQMLTQEGDANSVYARGYVQSKFTTLWSAICFL